MNLHPAASRRLAIARWGLALLLAATPALAQTSFVHALPQGFPAVIEGPVAGGEDACTLFHAQGLWTLSGLPQAATATGLPLTGPLRPARTWVLLTPACGAYLAVGPDLLPGTPDDRLVLVTGLPAAPVVHPTGTGLSGWPPIPVNDSTAVVVLPYAFQVLRLSATAGTVTTSTIGVPHLLLQNGIHAFGPCGSSRLAGLSAGADGVAGTGDEELAVLDGLDGESFSASLHPVPPGFLAASSCVTESGVPVLAAAAMLPALELRFARGLGGAVAFQALLVTPPAQGQPLSFGVSPGRGDSVVAWVRDDLGPGEARTLVVDVDTAPLALPGWYDDWNCGCGSRMVGEFLSFHWSAAGPSGWSLVDRRTGDPLVQAPEPWSSLLRPVMPNPGVLAVATDGSGAAAPQISIRRNLLGAITTHHVLGPGSFAGGGVSLEGRFVGPRIEAIAPGLLLALLDLVPGPLLAPTHVLLQTTPCAETVREGSASGPSPILLQGTVHGLDPQEPVTVFVSAPPAWLPAPAMIGISLGILPAGQLLTDPMSAPGSLFHLDPDRILVSIPFVLGSGPGAFPFAVQRAFPLLHGRSFHLQALGYGPGGLLHLSNLLLIVVS